MGQFKPMVKMETTEPSVILKLKKGGHVSSKANAKEENGHKSMCKADGGMMGALAGAPALVGRPVSASPVATPMKPSMAARRKAMMAKKPATKPVAKPVPVSGLTAPAMPPMKKGGKVHEDAAEDRAMIKKAMAGKKFATGGVVMGQGGYKSGGSVIPVSASKKGAEAYVNTKMDTVKKGTKTGATGEVKKGNGGGYAKGGGVDGNVSGTPAGVKNTTTGGVRLGNAGGFKKGGATKKFADGGAVQDDGRAVKMPQGNKKPSTPVSINQLSGTFKHGGKVKKYAEGGKSTDDEFMQQQVREKKMDRAMEKAYENAPKVSREMEDAMNPLSMAKEAFGKVKDYFTGSKPPARSVTKTKESVTVAKKHGGKC